MAGGVGGSHLEGGGRDVGGGDVGVGKMAGERDGDGAGAGADVEDFEGRGRIEFGLPHFGQDGFDEVFGFRAGNEDGGRDVQGEAIELLFAGNVLDGFVGEAAEDEGFVGGLLGWREAVVGIGEEGGAG